MFGVPRRKVGTFEFRVMKLDNKPGRIDMLWKGTLLVEMKSRDKNLDEAYTQATDYTGNLKLHEHPKYILTCDFETFRLKDLEEGTIVEFILKDLVKNVQHFGFIAGYQKRIFKEQDPANIKAAELMGKLHDRLKDIGYTGHPLEVYLVRILFCLFAEDTTIFNKQQFQDYLEQRTAEDGSDLASKLQELFQTLNTTKENRFKNLDEQLADFAYVNGKLFEETLPMASFDSKMRQALLDCCYIDWSKISPAIFGSMFQSVMNPTERRNLGAHYTSEKNILKLIKPLFLDELWAEFENIKGNKNKLPEFHKKISELKFLDPACGCGNFLVITYRELRLLEIEILRQQYKNQMATSIESIMWLDVDMMYGIEYEEFPARIAEVAMWLIDHQMNMLISNEFGQYFARLPLKKAANIVHGNALRLNWHTFETEEEGVKKIYAKKVEITQVITQDGKAPAHAIPFSDLPATVNEPEETYRLDIYSRNVAFSKAKHTIRSQDAAPYNYILGNPPFKGKKEQNSAQKDDVEKTFTDMKGAGVLDYVTCWYVKAAQYLQKFSSEKAPVKIAFVSTNSVSQGEQVSILWNELFNRYKVKIHFAHQPFKWSNEAKGKAAVHCVIIGFANFDVPKKTIFEYENINGEAHEVHVKNINPYLVEGRDMFLENRKQPLCNVPLMNYGSMPIDDGHLILNDEEKAEFIKAEPLTAQFIRPYTGGDEFINNKKRWCLWLEDANPSDIKASKLIQERIELTRKFRLGSKREATKKLATYSSLFGEIRQPKSKYLIIPKVSSEVRTYIPMGILKSLTITSGSALIIPNCKIYHFGILTSKMHMAWMKYTCGRMKSDYQYSASVVYNNYPWPTELTDKQVSIIEVAAQRVLDVRNEFPDNSLADLYSPNSMPPALAKAHNDLDKAVDLAYRSQPFISEAKRVEYLFELYEKYTADLFTPSKSKKSKPTK